MASTTQELEAFVRESLLRGLGKPDIEQAMLQAGWTVDQAKAAARGFRRRVVRGPRAATPAVALRGENVQVPFAVHDPVP